MANGKAGRFHYVCLLSAGVGLLIFGGSRTAIAAEDTNLSKMVKVDIAAQNLSPALIEFSQQAAVQILTPSNVVENLTTQGVHGEMPLKDALTRLLRGTPLTFHSVGENAIGIRIAAEGRTAGSPSLAGSDSPKEGKNDSSGGFRMAQVDPGKTASAAAVGNPPAGSQPIALSAGISEIVVTAQKRSERLQDVPVPVSVISAASLLDRNQVHLQDYYAQVPGLNLTIGNTGAPNLSIRGISTGNGTNPTVGIVIDDIPYGSSSQLGDGFVVPDVDPSDLARIEVLRGPQGTLYGASSIGGLIKYVTVDPSTDALSGRVEVGTNTVYNGAHVGYNVRGSVNVPLSDTWALRASAYYHDDPGYIDNVQTGERGVNRGDSAGAHLSAMWRPSEDFSLKLSALAQDSKRYGSPDVFLDSGLQDLQHSVLTGTGGYSNNIQALSATANAKVGGMDLTSATGYSVNKLYQPLDLTSLLGPFVQGTFGVPGAAIVGNLKTTKVTEEIRLSAPIGQTLDWLLGVFYTHENNPPGAGSNLIAVNPVTGAVAGTYLNSTISSTYEEYAAFTDLTIHFTDRFDVQIGGRESQNKQSYSQVQSGPYVTDLLGLVSPSIQPEERTKDNAFTYLVTPRLKISPDLMLYARLASGYRAGGPNTLATIFQVPQNFAPDKTQNYEVGFKGSALNQAFSFDASLYYIDWKNIQLQVNDPLSGEGYVANASRAKSEGVELSVGAKPLTGMTIDAWIVWNEAVLTEDVPATSATFGNSGDRLPYASRFSGNVSLRQEFPLTGQVTGYAGASVTYVGDREGEFASIYATPQRQIYPAYAQTDLRGGAKYDSWKFNLFVNNLADKRGQLSGGIGFTPANAFTFIQPRTVGLSVEKSF